MALALGVNVSYALSAGSSGCTSTSGALSICAQNGTTTTPNGGDQSTNLGITWQGVNSETSAYMPALSGGNTIIENLNFNFNGNGNPIAQGSNSGNTLNINVNKNSNIVVLMKGNTKGLQLGASGTGTMTIDFGGGADTARDFTLDLNDTANGDFSYKGNLVVKAGKGYGNNGSSVFNGYFNKKFIGNITLGYTGGGNASWAKNNLTLSSGIQGNLYTSAGTNTITITGDLNGGLTAGAAAGGFATAKNTITFTQSGRITGRIYTSGGTSNVIFGQNTGTITGNIDNNCGTLNLTATGNTGIIDLQGITIGTTGQATARNNITASTINSSNVTLNIGGVSISNNKNVIEATTTANMHFKKIYVSVVSNTNAENKVTSANGSITIDNITSESGNNNITNTNGTITLNNVLVRGGYIAKNTITAHTLATSSGATLTASGNFSSNNHNILTATNTATINFDSMNVNSNANNSNSITIAGGTLNVNAINTEAGSNIINATGGTVTLGNITNDYGTTEVTTSGNSILEINGTTGNVITMKARGGGTANNTINASTLNTSNLSLAIEGNSSSNNKNTITATNGTMSFVQIGVGANNNAKNTLTTTNGNITIATTTSGGGSNVITSTNGSITLTKTISANGGLTATNTITANNLIISNGATLTATGNHASNNDNILTATRTADITLASISVSDNANNSNTLKITTGTLAVSGAITASSGTNTIISGGTNTFSTINGNGGINLLNLSGTTAKFQNNISALGGKNIIAITATNSQNTFRAFDDSAIALTAKGSGVAKGQNIIAIADATSNNILNFSSISLYNDNNKDAIEQSAQNILSLSGTSTALTIGSISTTTAGKNSNAYNQNIIAKDVLSGNAIGNVALNSSLTTNSYFDNAHAFTGTLTISQGISANKGSNIISFKASNKQASALISNLVNTNGTTALGTAVSGSNTLYLDVSGSALTSAIGAMTNKTPSTFKNSSIIMGHIANSGTTNIKIVGTPNTTTTRVGEDKVQIGILGNINNNGGTTNIVLQDTLFAPTSIITNTSGTMQVASVGGDQAGNITTASRATTNLVTRFTNPVVQSSGISMYNINSNGTTNVVIQGNVNVGTNLNYSKGSAINLIFAGGNNNTADSFEGSYNNLAGNGSMVLGTTYQDGVKLSVADKTILIGDGEASFLDTYASYYTDGTTPLATITADRTSGNADTIAIHGLVVGDIYSLANGTSNKTYNVTIDNGSAFAGSISLDAQTTTAINIVMNGNSKLILSNSSDSGVADSFKIASLNIKEGKVEPLQLQLETLKQTNNIINIATGGASTNNVKTRENFRLLTIGNADATNGTSNPSANTGLYGDGSAVFMTYVNSKANQDNATLGGSKDLGWAYSDRIIIANIGDNQKAQSNPYYMQFAVDANTNLGDITYNASNDNSSGGTRTDGNIAVLTVVNTQDKINANADNKAGITLKTQDVLQGFDQIGGDLIAIETDITGEVGAGKTGYTTYFINALTTRGASEATQEVTSSAFVTNYDLYFANFNSLNKRMGELRDNNNSQGAWARIFNGSQSNDFTKSKSTYTTFQGGYDYAFGFEGANNYLGIALSYSMSSSTSDLNAVDVDGSSKGIDGIKSSAVEVALYNSYVQDEGWYNDTIAKFSYIFSDFTITGQESKYSTNNMAFTLSDEFGYRFKLGSEKEWYIDPQLEFAVGYFNQSNFIQTLGLSSLDGVADGIITTRTRFGSSFGYDFKKFTANKPIKASVYVGAFYEYDYISGGDVTLTTNLGGVTTNSSAVSSDGRVVMNVGTNMTIKDNTRIYFDFESSFAGKINTDYQVNVGVRYSFGENTGYTPMTAKKEVAPLKISEEKTEESKEVENTENKTEENKAQ